MIRSTLILMTAVFGMAACDRPAVVNVPPAPVVVPGPAGPAGQTGSPGTPGTPGSPGAPGESTAIIVTPPPAASAPTN